MTKILIDVEEIAGVIKRYGYDNPNNDSFVNDLADLFEREDKKKSICINCGHQIWMKYGYGYVHKYSNVVDCSGDGREIIKCSCSKPKPFNKQKFRELCGVLK